MPKFRSTLLQTIFGRSEKPEASEQPTDLASVAAHASHLNDPKGDLANAVDQLQQQIEYLLEEVGQENVFRTELSTYVKELRAELDFIKTARKVFASIALIVAALLLAGPIVISIWDFAWFKALPDYPKSALIISMIAAGVVIVLTLTRSVYRSASERQSDDFVPPQIKLIHELLGAVKG
jgi:hypothetical protein